MNKAAANDNARACYNLGAFYATGNMVDQDDTTSPDWYDKASALGHGKPSATLGDMYKLGQGVTQDSTKAKDQYFELSSMLDSLSIERDE